MAGAGAGASQGFPGVEDPEAAARIQQLRRIKQLKADLEFERGLREGLEEQVAAYKKRMADMGRMQQEQQAANVPAHTCEPPLPPSSPMTPPVSV